MLIEPAIFIPHVDPLGPYFGNTWTMDKYNYVETHNTQYIYGTIVIALKSCYLEFSAVVYLVPGNWYTQPRSMTCTGQIIIVMLHSKHTSNIMRWFLLTNTPE